MTFLTPLRLLLLVLPVALIVAYLLLQRSRPKAAARFASTDLLASVLPKRSGWQRHLPWAALLLSIVVGALAFAQPAAEQRTPKDRATVMLVLDTSASMTANDIAPSRLQAAQASARSFVDGLPKGIQVGLVTFDKTARLDVGPTNDRAALQSAIDAMQVGPGTATGAGIDLGLGAIAGVPAGEDGTKAPAVMVLMSDGTPTVGSGDSSPEQSVADATDRARAAGVPVTTIAFGTPDGSVTVQGREIAVPYDPEAMKQIADATGGSTFTAESAGQLSSVYDEIGRVVGYDVQTVELTALFAGLAFLLGCLAALAALIWTQRLA
jgi:Ca-activated chloride channel family protein